MCKSFAHKPIDNDGYARYLSTMGGHMHDWKKEVRAARDMLYMTQAEFAKRLRVHLLTVSRWERGTMVPRPRHQRAILRILEG